MKIDRVTLDRTFNLGSYESLRVGLEATVNEADNPLNVLRNLEDLAELYLQSRLARTEQPAKEAAQKEPEKKPTQDLTVNLDELTWTEVLAPDNPKGPWEKAEKTDQPPYPFIRKAIEEKGGPTFMEGYVIWMNSDGSLGRRKAGKK